ncbi:hypothetical protein BWQ96_08690 [Gracilariopsis chorda]|uniref:Uncharacterized protein n=1 Tax=Gracilariopsis chorda TaxID=448386 RepID=A0A2V3IHV0_9FLOR|nr:hypothetical protein BWQ96_08690 [Gracilariopsis chorda]|eukprot:PXF41603.1 hypothetical protein BWQ96_08690 [Gracilariopsis chorda]
MSNGESATHIISDLVLTIEGEVSDGVSAVEGADPNFETDHNTEEICIFDELTKDEKILAEYMERADKEWYINHFSVAMSKDQYPSNLSDEKDFC